MKLKRLICLTLSLLMTLTCFTVLTANAYVSTSSEASPNTVYAPIIKSNITGWDGKTTVGVNEDGCYEFVADGQQSYPHVIVEVPAIDASEYTHIVLEISGTLETTDSVRTYCRADYSNATNVTKSANSPKNGEGWQQVTLTYDSVDATITQLRFQPWGELATPEAGTTFYIRSIKFVKSVTSDMTYPIQSLWSTSNATFDYNATKDGISCTKVSPANVGTWTAINPFSNNGYNVNLDVYNYLIIDMYYENVDNSTDIIYPIILLKKGASEYAASSAQVTDISGFLYPMSENSGYDGSSANNRQTFTKGQWRTYVFPLEQYAGYDFETNGINCLAYWQLKFTDSGGDHNFNVYISSIKFTVEAPQKADTTITPELSGGVTTATVSNTDSHATTVYDDKLVWRVGNETKKGGSIRFNNVDVPVGAYNYVLVNCYYTGTAGGSYPIVRILSSKNGGISAWYNLYSHDGGTPASGYSTGTRLGVGSYGGSGKWITLVFPIIDKDIVSATNAFSGTDRITSFCVDLHGNGGSGDPVYVSSVTFSADPVPVTDEKVDDSIIFRGVQHGTAPTVETNDLRFVATIDDITLSNYSAVGFDIVRKSDNASLGVSGTTVYSSILAEADGGFDVISATEWNDKYIVALIFKGVPVQDTIEEIVVTPYLLDNNNQKISGMSAKVTIQNGTVIGWTIEVETQ